MGDKASDQNPDMIEDSDSDSENEKKNSKQLFAGHAGDGNDSDDQLSASEYSNAGGGRVKQKGKEGGSKQNTRLANDKKIAQMNINKQGDSTNFKRSIEIRNGIAIRSTNNVHRMTNAITLHCYIVSVSLLINLGI